MRGATYTIHMLRMYSDVIGRETHVERQRIAEKLAPFLASKFNDKAVELLPWGVQD